MEKKNIKKITLLSILGLMVSGCFGLGNNTSSSSNNSESSDVYVPSGEVSSSEVIDNSSTNTNDSSTDVVTIASIEITGSYKTQYEIGESLDLTGVELLVTYSDNSTDLLPVTQDMVTSVDMSTEGMKTVNVSYEGLTTSFYIFVNAPAVQKIDPEVTISIENGATLTIGKDSAPTVTVTEGLNYITYFEQDGVYVSDTLPTTPGTYSFIVEVEGNDQYNSLRVWRWFFLVEDKLTPEIEFSFEAGATFTIGVDAAPTVTVTEGLNYSVHYDKNEAFYSNEFPTEEGTYAMIVEVEGNAQYNSRKTWRVFTLVAPTAVEKVDPEVTISIENGDTLTIGKDSAPTVTVTEGLNYITYFEQDGVRVSDTLPTTPGTYSFIVEVEGNDQYNSLRVWRWFYLVEDKLTPEIEFSFEAGATLTIGVDTPTVTVTEGLDYSVHYEKNEAFYSNEVPTEEGTYAMIVEVEGNAQYNSRKTWRVFTLVAPTAVEKQEAEITFNYEAGTTFYIGDSVRPTVTVSEGADYYINYESETGYNSTEFPTEAGTYSLVVYVNENDTFKAGKAWLWFRLAEPALVEKQEAEITFNYERGTTFYIGDSVRPTVTVSEGADYVITYESETGYNSTEFPTEAGTYSLVVTVNENGTFKAGKAWLWFRLEAPSSKVDAEITFNYEPGTTFYIGDSVRPTVTVSEGADYYINYESEDGYNSTEFPTEAGAYSLVVYVNENNTYKAGKAWLWFRLADAEGINA